MTEQTLSDKIMYQMGDEYLDDGARVFLEKDVRETIKELKNWIDEYPENHTITRQLPALFEIKLNEIMGDKLV
jgi:hypothetical protein